MFFSDSTSRRRFLRSSIGGATAVGIGAAIPDCFLQASERALHASERILVVVQMTGGNDGLNTVIPYANDDYRSARPKLAIPDADVLKCSDELGFHPSMSSMRQLFEDGKMTVVCGVGYDQPNRSHFESMDIWHTCRRKNELRDDGWLGRFLATQDRPVGGDVLALHLGQEKQPFALASNRVRVPTIRELAEFQLRGQKGKALSRFLTKSVEQAPAQSDDLLKFLQSSTASALEASQRVTEASQDYRSELRYPETSLGKKLRVIAQLIDAGLSTRVYYVQLDGFDTHANQPNTHAILLREWSDAVSTFIRDLEGHHHGDRVCVMTFSEFGRRVAENASQGTDHGAAGPMFLCGGGLVPGIIGGYASLTDLQDGDLKHQTDFRQVYAAVLRSWLGVDPAAILGGQYAPLPLFASMADPTLG
ncbi:DUF1501 domain-containing protein [Novipirellula artificiosorum]|nr:DUF1501 domain-containing protein [Novipirellula artificiosorum]